MIVRHWQIGVIVLLIPAVLCLSAQDNAYLMHSVQPGETLYAIARHYHVDVKEILAINNIVDKEYKVKAGEKLKIPRVAATSSTHQLPSTDKPYHIEHIVKKGETLYKIASLYHTKPEWIKQANQLPSDAVFIGQTLKIPSADIVSHSPPAAKEAVKNTHHTPISAGENDKTEQNKMKNTFIFDYNNNETSFFDKGIATWIEQDSSVYSSRFYALHKTAPIGTILSVRNLMNNKTAYVKVVGKIPDIDDNKNIVVILSGSAARYLEAMDQKFLVEISYVNKKN